VLERPDSSLAVICLRINACDPFLLSTIIIQVNSDRWRQNLWLRSLQEHLGKNEKDRGASSLRRLAHECWSLWSSTRLENCRVSEETVEALRLLREETSNIRLGIITNGSAAVQRQKLAACGVASFVDVIFIGDDVETCLKTKKAFRDDDADDCVTKGGDDCQGDEHSRCHSWCGSPPFSILAEGRRKAGTMMETLEQSKNNSASEKTLQEHLVFWNQPFCYPLKTLARSPFSVRKKRDEEMAWMPSEIFFFSKQLLDDVSRTPRDRKSDNYLKKKRNKQKLFETL
jgi:hypothetical protein